MVHNGIRYFGQPKMAWSVAMHPSSPPPEMCTGFREQALVLKWPEYSLKTLKEDFSTSSIVYGAGRHVEGQYILSSRNKDSTTVDSACLVVPSYYGKYLEWLCYTCRYITFCWGWLIAIAFDEENDDFKTEYRTLAETVGAMWKYHQDALDAVIREVSETGSEIFTPGIRIRSLDEWVIRQHYNLAIPEGPELNQGLEQGYFLKDIIGDDAADVGEYIFPVGQSCIYFVIHRT